MGRTWFDDRERIWLRELLAKVAEHLELVGGRDQELGRLLLPVATRIRKRLHDGMPIDYKPHDPTRPRSRG